MSNTEIAKIFHTHRNYFIKWKNERNSNNVLTDPSDDDDITKHLQDALDMCPSMG